MRSITTWMLVLTITAAPTLTHAANQPAANGKAALQLKNVELSADGTLQGQVLTESGMPGIAAITVHSQADAKAVAQVIKTNESGQFEIKGLKNGRCIFTIGEDSFACRVWNHRTAPPQSLQTIAVVPSTGVVLGQNCNTCDPCARPGLRGRLACMSGTQKALLVGLVAAAIIIPIALDDDDDAS